jgi:hypothetical protein
MKQFATIATAVGVLAIAACGSSGSTNSPAFNHAAQVCRLSHP